MFNIVLYKPGSTFVNGYNKPHMGALVFSFGLNGEVYNCPLWLAQDDMNKPKDRVWLLERAIDAFAGVVDDAMPHDLPCVQPIIEDVLPQFESDDDEVDTESQS